MENKIFRLIFKTILSCIFTLLSCAQFATANSNKCESLFEENLHPQIQSKIEDSIQNLAELKITIDQAKANGANSIEMTALTDNFRNKNIELFKFVRKNNFMTKNQYVVRLKQTIANLQNGNEESEKEKEAKIREAQNKELRDSLIDGTRLIMHRIEPGPFKMGEVGKQVDKEITEPFEMAAAVTTQIVWKKVVELAKLKLGNEYKYFITDPSAFKGDTLPVENVSYKAVQSWIEALNKLSQIEDSSLEEIIPKHKVGDVYRLPTEEEWEFVVRGRGDFNEIYHFGNDESQLKEYAHYTANETQAVALLKPLVIEGREFYDMHGNAWEWTSSLFQQHAIYRVVRGGSYGSKPSDLNSSIRSQSLPYNGGKYLTFRLVKTVQ